ncbi:hypothetical protein, partial [Chryseobacterium sp.]|uniref:hypothetical protein n=1 Tax=Chryseobacterium sp. TaxID=1871047 RepID=UPI002FCB1BFC
QIMIFMSATPQVMLEHLPKEKFSYIYKLKTDYSYIKEIVFFKDDEDVYEIVKEMPQDEKAIYFSNDGLESYTLAIKNDNSNYKFICSRHNGMLKKKSDKATYDEIIQNEKFSCRVLSTTKVLDNGINLKDEKLKHIIIDIHDPISLVQCIGRKRKIEGADNSVTIYVKVPTQQRILISKTNYMRSSEDNNRNVAQIVFSRYMNRCYGDILKVGYRQYVCDLFDFPLENSEEYHMDKEQIALSNILENYVGFKMFDEMQQDFKENFGQGIFNTKNPNYRRRGFKSLQAIIEEDGLPYEMTRGREMSGEYKFKWYWMVIRKDNTICQDDNGDDSQLCGNDG